jgi:hypothetical protein
MQGKKEKNRVQVLTQIANRSNCSDIVVMEFIRNNMTCYNIYKLLPYLSFSFFISVTYYIIYMSILIIL